MDWDKLRVFHAAAAAGSFTHAGEQLGLSQSAVSRQVSALESLLRVPLFHRHARGLILTEQGDLLFRTTQDVQLKLETVKTVLTDSREKPHGDLRVTTTIGLGASWLTPRLNDFMEAYPEICISLILTDEELDLAMREADVAIRFRQPTQPDLIQRKLFTVHFHVYASEDYIERHGAPQGLDDVEGHRIIAYGGPVPSFFKQMNWLLTAGRAPNDPRRANLIVNNINGIKNAAEQGAGLAVLPDYLVEGGSKLNVVLPAAAMPNFDTYFVYPEELKHLARVQVFRDFMVANAQRWSF
jgi:DNA-binding transcriptional LysR family regulator